MRVFSSGAYMAKFRISFNLNGNQITYNSGDFPAQKSRELDIPVGACCVNVVAENLVFISTWKTVFRVYFESPEDKCFRMGGTTLNPNWREENC